MSLRRYCRYSAVWITFDTSRRNFQRHYKLIALLLDEDYNKQTLKFISLLELLSNDVLAELEILVCGLKKGRYQRYVQ